MPARRSDEKSCSRRWSGIARPSATSMMGTGAVPPRRASSVRATTAERLFSVTAITRNPETPPPLRQFTGRAPRSIVERLEQVGVALAGDRRHALGAALHPALAAALDGVDPRV